MDNEIADKLIEVISTLSSEQLQIKLNALSDLVKTWSDLGHVKKKQPQSRIEATTRQETD